MVELWDGILALPLIGTLDSARTQVVMESLLQKVVETGCEVAIIDITGVPTVDPAANEVRCCGVGNIAGTVLGEPQRRMVSHNGIGGHSMSRTQAFSYPCVPGTLVVLHSDGLHTQWRVDHQPGLASRHPAIIAAVLWREFSRGRDDVTVVVARGAP